ncbi:phage antirepressor [Rothia koreensis]|uniref:phage antirepressor n=1 Tax=Rothia koreensis TaxID=592378 RepID=UPI0037C52631
MSQLDIFNYQDHQVRMCVDEDGDPWFVASDIAKILGYREAKDMTRRLDEEDKGRRSVPTPGGPQSMTIISEPGLYVAVLGSQVEGARAFKRWVTREVLPAIRKTGSYGKPDQVETLVPRSLPEALRAYAREVEAREAMESYAKELEPKADSYDRFISGDGTYSVGNVAKMLGLSQNKLFAMLRNNGVLISKGSMRNTPYQQYMHHFAVKAYDFTRSDGTTGTSYTTRVQPSGVEFVARKLGLSPREAAA